MKGILIPVVSMTVLCLHCAAQEEAKSAESIEEYCKVLEEQFDVPDFRQVNHAIQRIYELDGWHSMSHGNPKALDLIRQLLREKLSGIAPFKTEREFVDWIGQVPKKNGQGQGFSLLAPLRYLIVKGDERDLDLIPIPQWREKLEMRVAGTNLINYFQQFIEHGVVSSGMYDIVPSVTNAGPQAHYVLAILRQYWQKMDPPTDKYWGINKDMSKIPAELLTMVVWFDEDGNPVCNVDLAKYGLTMPELGMPGKSTGKADPPVPPLEGERPREPETSNGIPAVESSGGFQPPEQTPPTAGYRRHLWRYAGIAVLILGIGGLYARSKISKS